MQHLFSLHFTSYLALSLFLKSFTNLPKKFDLYELVYMYILSNLKCSKECRASHQKENESESKREQRFSRLADNCVLSTPINRVSDQAPQLGAKLGDQLKNKPQTQSKLKAKREEGKEKQKQIQIFWNGFGSQKCGLPRWLWRHRPEGMRRAAPASVAGEFCAMVAIFGGSTNLVVAPPSRWWSLIWRWTSNSWGIGKASMQTLRSSTENWTSPKNLRSKRHTKRLMHWWDKSMWSSMAWDWWMIAMWSWPYKSIW